MTLHSEQLCEACASSSIEHFCTARDRVLPDRTRRWDILRCKKCGFGWTSPPLHQSEIPSHYPPTYLGEIEQRLREFEDGTLQRSRSWLEETAKARLVERFVTCGKILDVACGDGKFLWALDSRSWEPFGVDFSAAVMELVRNRLPGIRLVSGDIFNSALEPASFEVLTFWHALEHLPDTRRVLARAAALLRKGGTLVVSVPNLDSIQADLFRRHWYPFDDVPRHLYHFSGRSLGIFLAEAGFEVRARRRYSPRITRHSLKHSALNWSMDQFRSPLPYYVLKPLLPLITLAECVTRRFSIVTFIARCVAAEPVRGNDVAGERCSGS